MENVAGWIVGLTLFFGLVLALFFVITRGTRAVLGPRRRLEEDLGLEVLRTRLARGEISQAMQLGSELPTFGRYEMSADGTALATPAKAVSTLPISPQHMVVGLGASLRWAWAATIGPRGAGRISKIPSARLLDHHHGPT